MTSAPAPENSSRLPRQSLFGGIFPRALGLVAAAVMTGLIFAAWQANGPALLNALAANGLAWCL